MFEKEERMRAFTAIFGRIALLSLCVSASAFANHSTKTRLYRPEPNPGAVEQIRKLAKQHRFSDALRIGAMVMQPHAVWITGGTPGEAKTQVEKVMLEAKKSRSVPVLVAYNLPYRDCGQYSAGGASATAEYLEWINAVAEGIGRGRAIVALEPDGLGIIPYNTDLQGVKEWCQPVLPEGVTGEALNEARYVQLNGAVERFAQLANVSVYLDGTHSGWLGAGESAYRLAKAGVAKTQGFFLNASNYVATEQLVKYGTYVSKCLWFAGDPGSWGFGHYDWCASQYYPATATDFSTWTLTDQWYEENVESQDWVPYPGDAGLTHFIIDTSRNGLGVWAPEAGKYSGDAQTWCNPPGRGLGIRPTLETGNVLVDAYHWLKIPGESDGSCTRGTSGSVDPEWGIVDPAAGTWFPEQALELAIKAEPPLF
jgi:endoglucanase